MKSLSRKLAVLMTALSFAAAPSFANTSENHGHITITDRNGVCFDADSSNSDEDDLCCWNGHYHYVDEEDPSEELEEDASWPSKKEKFSEMFR